MKIDAVNSPVMIQKAENKGNNEPALTAEKHKESFSGEIDSSKLQDAVEQLNKKSKENNYDVQFAVYKDTKRVIVQVVDKTTKEVISTYPPKQILEMARMVEQEFKVLDKKV